MRIDHTEWESLDHDRFLVLLGALLLAATMLGVNNQLLSPYFYPGVLAGKQRATLVLLLVGAPAGACSLLKRNLALATNFRIKAKAPSWRFRKCADNPP